MLRIVKVTLMGKCQWHMDLIKGYFYKRQITNKGVRKVNGRLLLQRNLKTIGSLSNLDMYLITVCILLPL